MSAADRPRRPTFREPGTFEAIDGGTQPEARLEAAHETAAVLVRAGRTSSNAHAVARLVALTRDVGLDTLADLWALCAARSLPGALWRLYLLREWVQRDPGAAAVEYGAGIEFAEVRHVIAGVDPSGPQEIRRTVDQILRGAFDGDFAVALERAAAFCLVVTAGRAHVSSGHDAARSASQLQTMAADLTAAAAMWRTARLD
ncbi:MAG: hypothetical protein ACK5KO_11430 [Arachnia sp.]